MHRIKFMKKIKQKHKIEIKLKDIRTIGTCTGTQNTKLLLQLQVPTSTILYMPLIVIN